MRMISATTIFVFIISSICMEVLLLSIYMRKASAITLTAAILLFIMQYINYIS